MLSLMGHHVLGEGLSQECLTGVSPQEEGVLSSFTLFDGNSHRGDDDLEV